MVGVTSVQVLQEPAVRARPVVWQGCDTESWYGLIVPDAFAHPATYSRGLIHTIYRHLLDRGYVCAGATMCDPFAGVGLGALDAMTYGLRWVGVALEHTFVPTAQANLALWAQRYGFTTGRVLQEGSRYVRAVLAVAGVHAVVGSPPYAGSTQVNHAPQDMTAGTARWAGGTDSAARVKHDYAPMTSPGQLAALPTGTVQAVVSSPPYAQGLSKEHTYTDHATRATSSHRRIMIEKGIADPFYGTSPGQLGNAPTTFWDAASLILAEVAALLPPGGVAVWVVKDDVAKRQRVPFCAHRAQLCASHGLPVVETIHASLVEDCGTQEGLFGTAATVTRAHTSFFRRLAEKKAVRVSIMKPSSSAGHLPPSAPPLTPTAPLTFSPYIFCATLASLPRDKPLPVV